VDAAVEAAWWEAIALIVGAPAVVEPAVVAEVGFRGWGSIYYQTYLSDSSRVIQIDKLGF
jgi:hypothetical protein